MWGEDMAGGERARWSSGVSWYGAKLLAIFGVGGDCWLVGGKRVCRRGFDMHVVESREG
jgi:hypothetical protein